MLSTRNLSKDFVGVQALKDVNIDIGMNEVVGLVGENGAGKSTLMRLLAGVYRPTSGEIILDDRPVQFRSPREANDHGIGMVFQEQSLLLNLTVAENIFLGREGAFCRGGLINWRKLNAAARAQLEKVEVDIDPRSRAAELSFAARQMVELAKALALEEMIDRHCIILLDEPTSVLEQKEIDLLFDRVRALKRRASIVFVSHRLDEVLELSDRIYVMKDGEVVANLDAAASSVTELHQLMVGRKLNAEYYRQSRQEACSSDVVLEAAGLSAPGYRDVDFQLHRGEVLGIAGVIGSGREEMSRTLFGMHPPSSGVLRLDGKPVHLRSPTDAVDAGIGYIPRERRVEGLVLFLSVITNMTLARLPLLPAFGLIQYSAEKEIGRRWIERLRIRTPSAEALCVNLSGGNQQKVVLTKWLNAGSRILILDHPTRGLDVGAKEDVYELIRDLSAEGVSIVLTSDTLEETIGLSHRILVMRDGEITARFEAPPAAKPTQLSLVPHMV
jgi:ribose transport system ATP-binding protein